MICLYFSFFFEHGILIAFPYLLKPHIMKPLLDFIPLIIFFALFKISGIYVATGALIVATIIQVIVTYFLFKKVEKMQLITFAIVLVFGSLTLIFHNDEFIKWKVTILYTLFAVGLFVSDKMGKPLLKNMLGKELTLPDEVWKKLNLAWCVFFLICALSNIYVAFWLPLSVWVNFKVFGLLVATLVFALGTGAYIYRHMPAEEESEGSE